jgi:hypothetical protein
MRLRGLVWFGIGLFLYLGSTLAGRPINLRWTQVPLGWVIMGIGVVYLAYDAWKRRQASSNDQRPEG